MGIKYDTREIEQKLNSLITYEAKIQFLNDYLLGLKSQLAAFEAFESNNLNRLQEVTKTDYLLYGIFEDKGGIHYFNSYLDEKTNKYVINKWDQKLADKLGIKDIGTLLRRKTIEGKLSDLKGRIIIIEALLVKVKCTEAEIITPQPIESKIEQETFIFNNNFDKVPPNSIYIHFKAGLVEKGYLTEQDLNEYLKAAFELKAIPETLFKIKNAPSKEKIYVVFYTYYLNVAGKPHYKQPQYVELLGNYFEGFNNKTIRTNWAKGYNPKKH